MRWSWARYQRRSTFVIMPANSTEKNKQLFHRSNWSLPLVARPASPLCRPYCDPSESFWVFDVFESFREDPPPFPDKSSWYFAANRRDFACPRWRPARTKRSDSNEREEKSPELESARVRKTLWPTIANWCENRKGRDWKDEFSNRLVDLEKPTRWSNIGRRSSFDPMGNKHPLRASTVWKT